jgi:hypothetical protein
MRRYLCCDPRYPQGTPPDSLLTKTFYSGPRFVVFPELWPYVGHCLELGLDVALVIARESGDPAQYFDWATSDWMLPRVKWFVGNEPDGSGESSWIMAPAAYAVLWDNCRGLHGERWIAGMCSGDVQRARQYLQPDAAGLGVHLYTLDPAAAIAKLAEYGTLEKRLQIDEMHPADGFKLSDYTWPPDVPVSDFCFSDAQVPGMGLYV